MNKQRDLFEDRSDQSYLSEQLLTYIGNKRTLLSFIDEGLRLVLKETGQKKIRAIDVFSGSGVVSRYLKYYCNYLLANDLEYYVEVFNKCYLSNRGDIDRLELEEIIREINVAASENPKRGILSELYAPDDDLNIKRNERVFYTTRNANFIDAARSMIDEYPSVYKNYILAPLLYKSSVHVNTAGVFKGFYKNKNTGIGQFGGSGSDALSRITRDILIPIPIVSPYECEVSVERCDANQLVSNVGNEEFDVAYIDPPYNQHPYGSNYFMLNIIAKNSVSSEISKVSGIPTDWNRSDYNKPQLIKAAFRKLVSDMPAKYLLISFNSEGFITKPEMENLLGKYGTVQTLSTAYNVFRGSRNLKKRSKHVTEYLYLLRK